jgi:hypothetical protein
LPWHGQGTGRLATESEEMKPYGVRVAPWIVLGLFALGWLAFFSLTSPAPPGPDVFVFRDAGCNWARGGGFVAASVPHGNAVHAKLFASYTPGAPLLFGVVASWFGCSGRVDTIYNLFCATVAVLLIYRCFGLAVCNQRQRLWAALLLGVLLPTGMAAFDNDRPEMPAFCLLVAILLGWRKTHSVSRRALLLGCVGLVFLIHPFAGIVGWFLVAFLLIFEEPRMLTGRLPVVLAGTALYLLIVFAWLLSIWWQDASAIRRFLEHAAGQGTGAGVILHGAKTRNGYTAAFHQLFNPAFPASAALAASLLVCGLVVAVYAFRKPGRARLRLQCTLLLTVLLIFPFVVFPAQTNYLGLARALLVVVLLIGEFPLADVFRESGLSFAVILVSFVFLAPWVGLEVLQNIEARGSYLDERQQVRRVHDLFAARGLSNPTLLVDSGHYFLYKPFFPDLFNRNYAEPGDASGLAQGMLVCYSGTRAFARAELPEDDRLATHGWKLIDGGEDAVHVTLFGHAVMRRNWTWMCDVYARE